MINLQEVVGIVLVLLVAGAVFGLLFWLVSYVGGMFPGEGGQLFVKLAKIILVILAVLFIIGILISLAGGGPMFRWGVNQPVAVGSSTAG